MNNYETNDRYNRRSSTMTEKKAGDALSSKHQNVPNLGSTTDISNVIELPVADSDQHPFPERMEEVVVTPRRAADDDDDDRDEDKMNRNGWTRKTFHGCKHCIHRWPRCTAFFGGILIPLWTLIAVALGFGHLLSQFEGPNEAITNDLILKNRFFLDIFPSDKIIEGLYHLPRDCLDFWANAKLNNTTTGDLSFLIDAKDVPSPRFPDVPLGFDNQTTEELFAEVSSYMDVCVNISSMLTDLVIDYTRREASGDAFNQLSFNWIRCWNNSVYGSSNPLTADSKQIEAANNQPEFFTQVWNENRIALLQQYMEEYNCTTDLLCYADALNQSAVEATGSSQCEVNTGASGWFWFTVMTTVGYGNQSPTTTAGKALVAGLGWISIILFGGISLVAGSVINVIINDLFRRMNLKILVRSSPGLLIWAVSSLLWIYVMSILAFNWWRNRVPDFEATRNDSLWFAYITALTVGLGDYFLQPEVMFIADVFAWSATMQVGFVLLALFLGKVSDTFSHLFPDAGKVLEERLAKNDLSTFNLFTCQERNRKGLEELQLLFDSMNNCSDKKSRLNTALRKKELLLMLLEQTDTELKEFDVDSMAQHG